MRYTNRISSFSSVIFSALGESKPSATCFPKPVAKIMAEANAAEAQPTAEADMDTAAALLQGAAPAGAAREGEGEADMDAAAALLQGAAPPHPADAEAEAQSQQAIALHEQESIELRRMAEAALQPAPSGVLLAESQPPYPNPE
jgi:hypothetical protein